MTVIDARGLSCPQPVMLAMDGLKANPDGCQVIVDNKTALGNVTRYAEKAGYKVAVEESNGDYTLTFSK